METHDMVLRRADFSLNDEQEALRGAFRTLLDRRCPTDAVRAAEPLGFDEKLWRELVDLRAAAMGVPEAAGGDGAGLVELTVVAEEHGSHLAPVPLLGATVAARALARAGTAGDWLARALDGDALVAFAPAALGRDGRVLVPDGAIADAVVMLDGDDLVLVAAPEPPVAVPNQGAAPLAWWDPSAAPTRVVLAAGPAAAAAFAAARREWQLLLAAAFVGLADGALRLGVEHAKERVAFGVPIGFFQAVSHPLVDVAIGVNGVRRLVAKAAWYADHEPSARPELVPMAFVQATRTAMQAATVAVHVLGGVGFTDESDAQLFFRRVKGWALPGGDPDAELSGVADVLFGPARA